MDFLTEKKIRVESSGVQSIFGNGAHEYRALFLDGGFRAEITEMETPENLVRQSLIRPEDLEEYREQAAWMRAAEGAWLSGPRAALFVALGLGLAVPRKFRDLHGLQGVTLDE